MVSLRFMTISCITIALASLGGCKPKPLSPLYCEGGVSYKGEGMGGDCFAFSPGDASDATASGTGTWLGKQTVRYSVRRGAKEHYDLLLNGQVAGTIDRDDNWIRVKLTADPARKISLRDDPPGALN